LVEVKEIFLFLGFLINFSLGYVWGILNTLGCVMNFSLGCDCGFDFCVDCDCENDYDFENDFGIVSENGDVVNVHPHDYKDDIVYFYNKRGFLKKK